jgi:phosphoserine phosphatase
VGETVVRDAARAKSFDAPVARRLMEFLQSCSEGTLATFDADGTLWSVDVGEAFLRFAGEEGHLPNWPRGPASWQEYERRLATGNLRHAFEFCVTAFEGADALAIAALAENFVRSRWAEYVFPAMKDLVRAMRQAEVDVWIVSGSPAWCVVPGAALVGIPENRVIAAIPALEGGRISDRMGAPLPTLETKVDAIVASAGRPPHFAAGNSTYDYAMLESARAVALLIDPPTDNGWHARKNGPAWLVQRWGGT